MASKKQAQSIDAVLGVTTDRVTIGEHSFDAAPPKVSEKARFNRMFTAEEQAVQGDEAALTTYAETVAEVLNARNPSPGPVDAAWVLDQAAGDVTEAIVAIGTARGNRGSQQGRN